MTACLYCNNGIPFLVSDCVAIPRGDDRLPTIPASIVSQEYKLLAESQMFRKTFRVGNAIFAFAGESRLILDFMSGLPSKLSSIPRGYRAMEYVGILVEQYHRSNNGPKISCLGITDLEIDGKFGMNYVAPVNAQRENSTAFGEMVAIGSGGEGLINIFRAFGNQVWSHGAGRFPDTGVEILGAVGAADAKLIFETSSAVLQDRRTWGGYLQLHMFDRMSRNWFSPPAWAHFAYNVIGDEKKNHASPISFLVVYSPSAECDYLALFDYNEQTCLSEFSIRDPSRGDDVSGNPAAEVDVQIASLTFFNAQMHARGQATQTFIGESRSPFKLRYTKGIGKCEFVVDHELLQKALSDAFVSWRGKTMS